MKLNNRENIPKKSFIWLLSAQALCILPLLWQLPLWIAGVWVCALIWRLQIYRGKWGFPSFFVKLFLGIACFSGIFFSFSTLRGVDPMVGFLVCAFVLKVVEMKKRKDAVIILFIGFIAISAQFLFAQDLLSGIYGVVSLCVLVTAWQVVYFPRELSLKRHFYLGGLLVAKTFPFMVLMFLVLPRLTPLWAVPVPQNKGQTGFSEMLKLGDISELIQSSEVAFRVRFNEEPPAIQSLYWKGLVLDEVEGQNWKSLSPRTSRVQLTEQINIDNENTFQYSVILEPHYQRWLFALPSVVSASSSQLRLENDIRGLLYSRHPVINKAEYKVVSSKSSIVASSPLSEAERKTLTRLPEGNPRSIALAKAWVSEGFQQEEIVNKALSIYGADFIYSLRPSAVSDHPVDHFLFESKKGFCEHFAVSFVVLMRAANIPARIVVGYQGGDFNEVESYFIVRQRDAHAWAEIWLEDRGWISLDPTAAVAPSRIERGAHEALSDDEREYIGQSRWGDFLGRKLYQHWDALTYSWNRWVLNYDRESQKNVFENLFGDFNLKNIVTLFIASNVALGGGYGVFYLWRRSKAKAKSSQELQCLLKVLRCLERLGHTRATGETLEQFLERLESRSPLLAEKFRPVADSYNNAVYAESEEAKHHLQRFAVEFLRYVKNN